MACDECYTSAIEENECERSLKQVLYERDISAGSHSERNVCTVQTNYEWDELVLSANIAQYECVT